MQMTCNVTTACGSIPHHSAVLTEQPMINCASSTLH